MNNPKPKKLKGWREYPTERPIAQGYYRIIAKDGARAAGYWTGYCWQYDILGSGMKAAIHAEDVKFFKEWE